MSSKKCTHRNKAIDGLYKVCKDCGDVLEEDSIQRDSHFEKATIRKTIGRNEVRSKNVMYFRSGIKDQKLEEVRRIGEQSGVRNTKNKRKEEIEIEVEDKRAGRKERMKLSEIARKHDVKDLKNKKKEDIIKDIAKKSRNTLEDKKLPELREIAKKYGMRNLKNTKKADIIGFIRERQ